MTIRILVVDDHEVTRTLLKEVLEKQGYSVCLAGSGEDAVRWIQRESFPVVISDIRMLRLSGMDVLREVKKRGNDSAVILMTGFGSMDGAVQAIQEGAFDYLSKPFRMDELKGLVSRATKHCESLARAREIDGVKNGTKKFSVTSRGVIGKSPKIVEVFKILARAAMSTSTVLVIGESGTGKELVARAIHENSQRRAKKFIAFNCGSFSETAAENELLNLCQEAQGGTLFLEAIDELSVTLQIKLLRVLQETEFNWGRSEQDFCEDVRFIVASDCDLERLVKNGKFRDDLLCRLKVITIELPPMRERMEDLPDLIQYFLSKYADKNHKPISHLSDEAMDLLKSHHWPGNVRELEYAIERAVAMAKTQILFPEDFPSDIFREREDSSALISSTGSLEEIEKAYILKVLEEVHYNKSKASDVLGIDRATLYRKAQRYAIDLRVK